MTSKPLNASFRAPGEISLSFTATEVGSFSRVQDIARSAAAKAFNAARKNSLRKIQAYLIGQIMEHPDVRQLSPGTELIAALGIANSGSVQSALEASLFRNTLGPQSGKGLGRGATSPTKGKTAPNRLPSVTVGITEEGRQKLIKDDFASYVSENKKKGTSSEIPWLNWMLNKSTGRVFGSSVRLGDFPQSRTGDAAMRPGGSFSINSWLKSKDDFLTEVLSRQSVRDEVLSIFRNALDDALEEAIAEANRVSKGQKSSGRVAAESELENVSLEDLAVDEGFSALGGVEDAEDFVDGYVSFLKSKKKEVSSEFIGALESVAALEGLAAVKYAVFTDYQSRTKGLKSGGA